MPISLARVPKLMAIGRIPVDVALIQVSMPDEFGYVSLGLSVDVIPAAVARARLVIALRCGADDRQALEQLCRTIPRPPCRPELCEGAACKVVAAGIHAAAGCAGATAQAALDPFGVRVTSLREVSGPPLREPRRAGAQRKVARAGGAAGTRTTRAGRTAGRV